MVEYVRARDVEIVPDFGERGPIDLIVERGAAAIDALPDAISASPDAGSSTARPPTPATMRACPTCSRR